MVTTLVYLERKFPKDEFLTMMNSLSSERMRKNMAGMRFLIQIRKIRWIISEIL